MSDPQRTDDHSSRVYLFEGDLTDSIYQLGVGDVDGRGITGTIRYILGVGNFFFPSARSRGDCGDNGVCQFGYGFLFSNQLQLIVPTPTTSTVKAATPNSYGTVWTIENTREVFLLRVSSADLKAGPTVVHAAASGIYVLQPWLGINPSSNDATVFWAEQTFDIGPGFRTTYARQYGYDGASNIPKTPAFTVGNGYPVRTALDHFGVGSYVLLSNDFNDGTIVRVGAGAPIASVMYRSASSYAGYGWARFASDRRTGNIVVVWGERVDSNVPYYLKMSVYTRDLVPITELISNVTGQGGTWPVGENLYEILNHPAGGFVLVWGKPFGYRETAEQTVAWELYARRFNASGVPSGPSVLLHRSLFLNWESYVETTPDTEFYHINIDPVTGGLVFGYAFLTAGPQEYAYYESFLKAYNDDFSVLATTRLDDPAYPPSSNPDNPNAVYVSEVVPFGNNTGVVVYTDYFDQVQTKTARYTLGCLPDPGIPILSVNENPFVFEDTSVGDSSKPKELIATNIGTKILIINEFNSKAPFLFDYADLPVGLLPGESMTFTGSFEPKVQGLLSDTVTIVTNAGSSPDLIGVSGTGVFGMLFLGVEYAFNNLSTNPQNITINTPANIPNGALMVLTLSSRGSAWNVNSPGWNIVERSEAFGNAKNGAPSVLVAFKVKTEADTATLCSRVNDTSRLAQGQIAFYGTNRNGGSWELISKSFTRGFSSTDAFTGAGVDIGFEDALLVLSTFNAATPYAPHKSIRSTALPYDRIPDRPGWAPSDGWTFQGLNGWTQGALPLASNWVDQIHLRGAPPVTGDITYVLGDATSPRTNLNHAMVVTAFKYVGGEFNTYLVPNLAPKAVLLGSMVPVQEAQEPVYAQGMGGLLNGRAS